MIAWVVNFRPHPRQAAPYASSCSALSRLLSCQCPLPLLCFQSLPTIKFCNRFVLITIQIAGGVAGVPPLYLRSSLQIRTFVFNHFQDAPPATLFVCRGWAYPYSKNTPTMHEHKRAVRQIKARWKLTRKVFLFVSSPHYVLTSLLRFQGRRNSSRRRRDNRWLLWRRTECSSTRSSRMTRQPRFLSAARSTATGVAPSAR